MTEYSSDFAPISAAFFWYGAGFKIHPVRRGAEADAAPAPEWLGDCTSEAIGRHWLAHPDDKVACTPGSDLVIINCHSPPASEHVRDLEAQFAVPARLVIRTQFGEQHVFRRDPSVLETTRAAEDVLRTDSITIDTGDAAFLLPPCDATDISRCDIEAIDDLPIVPPVLWNILIGRAADSPPAPLGHACGIEDTQVSVAPSGTTRSSTNPFAPFSLTGHSDRLQQQAIDEVPILGGLALLGQSTLWCAAPNVGKTAMAIRLAIDTIRNGTVAPEQVYFMNMDDSTQGLADKVRIAEEFGFHMLGEHQQEFRGSSVMRLLGEAADKDQARGLVVIIDVIKKVTSPNSKRLSSAFGRVARHFVGSGGTIIGLHHVNKHLGPDGKPIYAGTADLVQDLDAAFLVYQTGIDEATKTKVITFECFKSRGDLVRNASYRYSIAPGQSYRDLLDSVTLVDPGDADAARRVDAMRADVALIDIVRTSIAAGIDTRMALVSAMTDRTKCTKRRALAVLDAYCGSDTAAHLWTFVRQAHGAMKYRLHQPVA